MSVPKKLFFRKILNKIIALLNLNKAVNILNNSVSDLRLENIKTREDIDTLKLLLSKILIQNNLIIDCTHNIQKAEFKVYSQWGDDGIIQYIINKIDFKTKKFIELGVQNYTESNTRFLLLNNNWSGLVIDGSKDDIKYIQSDPIYWKYDLKAIECFITKSNINNIIEAAEFKGDIGILSIDIDGNDYWIWKTITIIKPTLVIIEFNAVFGIDRPLTIPYSDNFIRENAHFSNLYYGASLSALVKLGREKGYSFIGTNSASVNAYFIKTEHLDNFKQKYVQEVFSISKFSESRDKNYNLNYLSYEESRNCIRGLPMFNVDKEMVELF